MTMCTCEAQLQPHDRMPGVCPELEPSWMGPFVDQPLTVDPCDDCGRLIGHNPEVEH